MLFPCFVLLYQASALVRVVAVACPITKAGVGLLGKALQLAERNKMADYLEQVRKYIRRQKIYTPPSSHSPVHASRHTCGNPLMIAMAVVVVAMIEGMRMVMEIMVWNCHRGREYNDEDEEDGGGDHGDGSDGDDDTVLRRRMGMTMVTITRLMMVMVMTMMIVMVIVMMVMAMVMMMMILLMVVI